MLTPVADKLLRIECAVRKLERGGVDVFRVSAAGGPERLDPKAPGSPSPEIEVSYPSFIVARTIAGNPDIETLQGGAIKVFTMMEGERPIIVKSYDHEANRPKRRVRPDLRKPGDDG